MVHRHLLKCKQHHHQMEEEEGILLRRNSSFTLDQLRDVKWLQDTIIRCDHDLGTKDHIFCAIGHLGLQTIVLKTISIVIDDYKSIKSLVRFPHPFAAATVGGGTWLIPLNP